MARGHTARSTDDRVPPVIHKNCAAAQIDVLSQRLQTLLVLQYLKVLYRFDVTIPHVLVIHPQDAVIHDQMGFAFGETRAPKESPSHADADEPRRRMTPRVRPNIRKGQTNHKRRKGDGVNWYYNVQQGSSILYRWVTRRNDVRRL